MYELIDYNIYNNPLYMYLGLCLIMHNYLSINTIFL